MEAVAVWLKSLGEKTVFPGLLVSGSIVLLGFKWISPLFSAVLTPDRLKAYAAGAVLVGATGLLVINFRPVISMISQKLKRFRRWRTFHALPLDAKFAIMLVLAGHEYRITLPGLPTAFCDALVDANYGYTIHQGAGYVQFEFSSVIIPYLRKHRAYFYKISQEHKPEFSEFCDRLQKASEAKDSDPSGWMRR